MTDDIKPQDQSDTNDCKGDPENCDHIKHMATTATSTSVNAESMEDCMGKSLEKLSNAFMASARRWEMIVYPALVAFIILAAYGFYLIYSLTSDISAVTKDVHRISTTMENVAKSMESVAENMIIMTATLDGQSKSMHNMEYQMRGMNMSISQMRYDMSSLNQNVGRPMSFMNNFMPW